MSHHEQEEEHVLRIVEPRVEESNNSTHSWTSNARIFPISDKFQSLKSAWWWTHQRWHETSFLLCVISLWLDPLFCYSLGIDDDRKRLRVDKKLGTTAIVLRSFVDFLYAIHVVSKFGTGFSLPREFGIVVNHKAAWKITKKSLMDILSVLPLPQVVFLIILYRAKDMGYLKATNSLIIVILLQYIPRIIRMYPFFRTVKRTSGILIGSPAFNLSLYVLACHVIGSFWYLFAVERITGCWQENCEKRFGSVHLSCVDIEGGQSLLTQACSVKSPNATIFNFGLFDGALGSGIVDSTNFFHKFCYSFWFGLQSLSSLGQNLEPSMHLGEILFAVITSILGFILFVFLIGYMQTYLQFRTVRLEKMRAKGQEIDLWMAFHLLPRNLKKQIKEYQQYKWRKIRGIETLLHHLPKDIRRDIMHHICLALLMKVPMLQNMDRQLFDAICDHLKHVFYAEHSCVVRKGDPLIKMIFVTRGTLLLHESNGESNSSKCSGYLEREDFYGEELFNWALYTPSLLNIPFSNKTVHAHTKVEAFVLTANDLKKIVSKFMGHFDSVLRKSPGSNLEQWERRVASIALATYRRRKKRPYWWQSAPLVAHTT